MNKIHKNKPKHDGKNPYATNRGGLIAAPAEVAAGDPRSVGRKGEDLRMGKRDRHGK